MADSPDATEKPKLDTDQLAMKVPQNESTKPTDALSSPGSISPTTTTPAVHDVSTDTSPDNEGPQYLEPSYRKAEPDSEVDERNEGSSEPKAAGKRPNVDQDSTKDQMLQASIMSSVAPDLQESSRPTTSGSDKILSKPAPSAAQSTEAGTAPDITPPEVPDSQGETLEQMDIDGAEAIPAGRAETVLGTREQNIPAQNAAAQYHNGIAATKENSQVPERAVTRVSSGAMRLKSVSEIVGATPRPTHTKEQQTQLTPTNSTPQSPASRNRNGVLHRRERSRGQTTVLFGKQPKRLEDKAIMPGHKEALQPSEDYFTPLFLQNYANGSSWMQPLEKILFHASKTLTTPDTNLAIQEHQACRVLKKVYNLQQSEKWSLRQPKRVVEPTRQAALWDVMLGEVKWMRTDFREERKWKTAVARNLAYACAEWHDATPEDRKTMQVAAVIPKVEPSTEVAMPDAAGLTTEDATTPDLVPSAEAESPLQVDELADDFVETVAPSAIFNLQEDDVVFGLRRSPTSDQLLEELPLYGAPLQVPKLGLMGPEHDPDAHWRRPALPLSKYVIGPMKVKMEGPPRKRSKYDYSNEDSDDELDAAFVGNQLIHHVQLPPTTNEVALFNTECKPIRDRLHAGHQFRPPSEHPMPTQNFYECRNASQWTVAEDDELRGLVREYSYNWSLISTMLATISFFKSGAERRTPWECFERWINLEGLPSDMQKTQYFKAYNSRIETAQRVIAQQNQIAAQQATASGNAVTPVRRRPSTPLRVERRRNQKHLTLIDAMRKLAKKRETNIQKQQHTASQNAAIKKPNEPVGQKPAKTPRDYSLMRWERDQALAEKMAQYAQKQEVQRRVSVVSTPSQRRATNASQAAMQARAQQAQGAQMAAGAAGGAVPVGPNAHHVANPMNGAGRGNIPGQVAAAAAAAAGGQNRPRAPMPAAANGIAAAAPQTQMNGGLVPPQMNGATPAQLQAMQAMQAQRMQMPNQQPDAAMMMRAQRISEQQRVAVQLQQAAVQQQLQHHQQQLQQQQHHQQPQPQQSQHQRGSSGTPGPSSQQNSPPNVRNGVNGINQQNYMANAQALMAQFNTAGNTVAAAAGANGMHMATMSNGSPLPRQSVQFSTALQTQLAQLEQQFKSKNPNLTPEQARHLATEHLTRAMMAQRQNAMNAAAGGPTATPLPAGMAATTSPHQYAALLRQQQQAQQAQQAQQQQSQAGAASSASPVSTHQRQSSGSATPSAAK